MPFDFLQFGNERFFPGFLRLINWQYQFETIEKRCHEKCLCSQKISGKKTSKLQANAKFIFKLKNRTTESPSLSETNFIKIWKIGIKFNPMAVMGWPKIYWELACWALFNDTRAMKIGYNIQTYAILSSYCKMQMHVKCKLFCLFMSTIPWTFSNFDCFQTKIS